MTSLKKAGLMMAGLALTWLAMTGTASAASSPTVTIVSPTGVAANTATLHADIASHGVKTTYYFSYGPTTGLGDNSPVKSTSSSKTIEASYALKGLQSGTTYYYKVTAVSAAGTTTTGVKAVKTTGPPPPSVTTGPAIITSRTGGVTLTGSVDVNDATTTYYFDYGTSTSYGTQSAPVTVKGTSGQQPVSFVLPPLAPGVVYHYTLVATHGGTNTAVGADSTFYTPPATLVNPPIGASTTPSGEIGGGPFSFTTSGHLRNTTAAPQVDACYGTVTVAFKHEGHQLYHVTVPLNADCTFNATEHLSHLPVKLPHGVTVEHLQVYTTFNGNYYLAPHRAGIQTIALS